MKKTFSALVICFLALGALPALADLPSAAVFDVVSTSASNTAHDKASVSVKGSKAVGLISYTVTATSAGKPTVKVTVTPPSSATSWEVPLQGLEGGSSYSFIVTTTNASGSTDSDATLFSPKSVPATPTVGTATAGIEKATLTWSLTDTGGLPLTKFVISGGGKTYDVTDINATSFEATGLNPGQNVSFSIVATNSLGNSSEVKFGSVRIPAAPGLPSGVDAVAQDDGSVKVTWTAPTDDGGSTITGYSIALTPANGTELTTTVRAATQTSFSNVGAGTWTAKVAATNLAGTGLQAVDASPIVIAAPPSALTLTPNPTISGSAVVGQSLTAVPGTWDSGVSFTYQWNQDGNPISGANASSFVLSNLVLGSTISVSVTGAKSGYASSTKTSASTTAVVAPQNNSNQNQGGGNTPTPPIAPAPVPSPASTPTAIPTPKPTPSAQPLPTSKATPTPSSVPTPMASNSPSSNPSPSAAISSVLPAKPIAANTSVAVVSNSIKPASVVQLNSGESVKTASVKKNSTFALTLPSVAKGTTVKQVLKGPDGKSFTLVSGTTTVAGQVSSPILKFAKPGKYTLTITLGTKNKVVTISVK